jgi:hypothetical protein
MSAEALDAAGKDADANAGSSDVNDPVGPCPLKDPKGPLWVRLDLTKEQAAKDPGSLRLQGDRYNSTLAIAGNFKANPASDESVDIVFEGVPIEGKYTLTYIGGGKQVILVEGEAYSSLQDDTLPEGEDDSENDQADEGNNK